ncbi:MAG: nuclease A inhibitor family protein [Cyanobacteria bacterium P01_A01_bin.83]
MTLQIEQIVTTLETLTKDICFSLVGDEPYIVIPWEVEEKGEFSWEKFLIAKKALTSYELNDFMAQMSLTQSSEVIEHYQNLIVLLQANLSQLSFYGYSFPEIPEDLFGGELPIPEDNLDPFGIPLIIGLTTAGEWIGLVPKQSYGFESASRFIIPDSESIADSTLQLISQIESTLTQVKHQLKSRDWRISNTWQIIISSERHEVITKLLMKARFLSIIEINEFFNYVEEELEEYEEDEELPADLQQAIALRDYFQSQLLNAKVYNLDYVISDESFTIHYIFGETKNGDWVGLVTDSYTF